MAGPSSSWWSSTEQFPAAHGEPEVDPVARRVQRPAGQLLDAPDPVAQGAAGAEKLLGRAPPLALGPDEAHGRAHAAPPVRALAGLDRRQDRVAEQPQRVVVLQREQ